jgi:hypothetical protein
MAGLVRGQLELVAVGETRAKNECGTVAAKARWLSR